ncbi:hypothetical protein ACMFMG_004123 [Clarireedia jacksonii]
MSEVQGVSPQPSQNKFTRYRSVRVAPAKSESPPANQHVEPTTSMSRTKSMSRYRRPKLVAKPEDSPPMPSLPQSHGAATDYPSSAATPISRTRRASNPDSAAVRLPADYAQTRRPIPMRSQTTVAEGYQSQSGEIQDYNGTRQSNSPQEQDQPRPDQHRVLTAHSPPPISLPIKLSDEDAERLLAEQKRKDLERLEATLNAAAADASKNPPSKFGFFSKRRGTTSKTTPPTSLSNESAALRAINDGPPRNDGPPKSNGLPVQDGPPKIDAPVLAPVGIQQGGGGIVPQTDAPISASNMLERRVLIRCKQSSINLPVDAETTPWELLNSAANIMTANIDPRTAVLLESYTQLGLERRIRRYEHVRDIMNSWDRDTQNALLIEDSDSPSHDKDLEATSVPKEAPGDVTVYLYHSCRPGKWNKRYITLLSSGQVYISKKPGAAMSDKDSTNICHLSDFDIYTPTPHELRKNLKPPKKNCYAVKSQQKTSMFISTENFVHFFCSDDERVAHEWYSAVQTWRSWYLVHKKGEGQKKETKTVKEIVAKVPSRPGTNRGPTHRVKVSVDESPYTIGTFSPLLDMNRFDKSSETEESEDEKPKQVPFHMRNISTVAPLPSPRQDRSRPPVSYRPPPGDEDEFSSHGLLGRTYSERQKAQKERENSLKNGSFPDTFLTNPATSTLTPNYHSSAAQQPSRSMSMRSTTKRPSETHSQPQSRNNSLAGAGRNNSLSTRVKPKPLLDFTPQFVEAPQWNKKGKGHGVDAPEGVKLVEVATTVETALDDIPRARTLFRREDVGMGAGGPRTGVRSRETSRGLHRQGSFGGR